MSQEQNGRTRSAPRGQVAEMRVKRSVSPDGRIDSLSIEVTAPLEGLSSEDLARQAREIVEGEAKIVEVFLGKEGKAAGKPAPQPTGNGADAAPARMLSIRAMDTEWGRRLFLAFKVNGEEILLFGKRKIAAALAAAGTPLEESVLEEGLELDLPCRVVTGRTQYGRYLSIEKVLPASAT